MIKNYLKISWRNLLRNKGYSFINIFGLGAGMTICLLIMIYIVDETSYDKHHKDSKRLFRIASEVKGEKWVGTPAPLSEGLKIDFPEVEQTTRLLRFPGTDNVLLRFEPNKKQFFETNMFYVDSTFFQLFDYDFKFGDINTALKEPNTIVIAEAVATKLFGKENPVDKVLSVGLASGDFNYTVKGVFRNNKNKSHIPANLLLSMNNEDTGKWVDSQSSWASNSIFHTYVKLGAGSDPKIFESKLNDFLERNGGKEFEAAGFKKDLFIQLVEDIYLHSNFGYEVAANGNIKYLYIFSSIAAFILLIACINFMNLTTARSEKRAREVGMRKVIGAPKSALIAQFLGESLLMCGLALVVTLILFQLLLPGFNQLTGKELSLIESQGLFPWLLLIPVITGLVSGLYPALFMSSLKPASILKAKAGTNKAALNIRKGLVVFQFTISTVLILGAILIGQQLTYMSNLDLGFDKNQKIVLPIQTSEATRNIPTLKNELLGKTSIIEAGYGGTYPGIENVNSMLFYPEGNSEQEKSEIHTVYAEPGYIETLRIELVAGREFSSEFQNDRESLIMNESAIKRLGYSVENALGRVVHFDLHGVKNSMTIVGIVKDYHFESLHENIKPLALTVNQIFKMSNGYLILDSQSDNYSELIGTIQQSWIEINGSSPFVYSFLDQDFQRNYQKEQLTAQLIHSFTVIAIVIACLGLFGLAAFTAEQRFREISAYSGPS